MQRNRGLIAVAHLIGSDIKRINVSGFVVCLTTSPFLEVVFKDGAIFLHAAYPRALAYWNNTSQEWQAVQAGVAPLPKNPKMRHKTVHNLGTARVKGGSTIKLDLCAPDSLARAEFYVQTIITKIKYMVTNNKWFGPRSKNNIDFPDLIDEAAREYHKKIVVPALKNRAKQSNAAQLNEQIQFDTAACKIMSPLGSD